MLPSPAKIKVRDIDIGGTGTGYLAQLDTIASNLATAVNTLHATGFEPTAIAGGAFFTGGTTPRRSRSTRRSRPIRT